jgi:hypothetical protein
MADINIRNQLGANEIRPGGGAPQAPRIVGPTAPSIEQSASQRPQGPSYFGYHNDSSISARLAQQGVPPNALNLRIAQQMLRYGIPLGGDSLAQLRHLWQTMGANSLVDLEALMALFASGHPASTENMAAMTQLLSGGPMSHLFARLTMVMRNHGQLPQAAELQTLMTQFWKLGNGPEKLGGELAQFEQIFARMGKLASGDLSRLPPDVAQGLNQIRDFITAQQLLVKQPQNTVYVPFFQWRDQQPMPGELLVQADQDPAAQAAGYAQVALAVDTRNLGRMHLDFTVIRGHLSVRLDVPDAGVKQLLERGLPDLRHKLVSRTPYNVATILCQEVGQAKAVSVLLPKRRDLRKLGRAIGVL